MAVAAGIRLRRPALHGPVADRGKDGLLTGWIGKAGQEGATIVLDGRDPEPSEGCENGFWVGQIW
ncbi:hypothetical protein FAK_32690 [Desulfoferula mesophila]|uniref:Uncharacterized protein n=1 Tax=Desulfoferula mesophila TaxID=3058419 RepID=A0AAU9EG95_9BACT|nr:hypothetical protein FAK_32690 [Desulfoferula mesophilus]